MQRPVRVLLIEDDEDDRLIAVDLLDEIEGTDYVVTWVADPAGGIAALKDNAHDVCLLDYRLGPLTGVDLLEAVSGHQVPPSILMTGQADDRIDRSAAAAGAADFLVKGTFSAQELDRAIRYATRNAETLRAIRRSEARFRSVVAAAADGIVLLNETLHVVEANPAARTMFRVNDGGLVGQHYADFVDDPAIASAGIAEGTFETTGRCQDGNTFPIEGSAASWLDGGHRFWSIMVRDVTEKRQLLDQLAEEAFTDGLTGLGNRNLMRREIARSVAEFETSSNPPSLLMIGIDGFRNVNDLHGHEAGDQLLKIVAHRLRSCVRRDETLVRLGGDEFALFVEWATAGDVEQITRRLFDEIRQPFKFDGRLITITASIGVAVVDNDEIEPDELIRNADIAMGEAKSTGRNRLLVFEPSMSGKVLERISMEEDLRAAIDDGQIEVHFQPYVDLATGAIRGAEALARWHHPVRGPVPPPVFIDAAERANMIVELGRSVLRQAVDQLVVWRRRFDTTDLSLSVNVSARQLNDPELVPFVVGLLSQKALPAEMLTLEITESVMVGDADLIISRLETLRGCGIRVALDDFGTGYSSLSYLQRLPVDILKLDRAFVVQSDAERGRALVDAVGRMSESLGLQTVAEGVETIEQRDLLVDLGYDRGQGYLWAKPMSADAMLDYLAEEVGART